MSVFKRKTPTGETAVYHYSFMLKGKRYRGVCEGCTNQKDAIAYEKEIVDRAAENAKNKTLAQMDADRRAEISGGNKITLENAFAEYLKVPAKRTAGEHQIATNNSYWNDFLLFMQKTYPEIVYLSEVTARHAGEYITLLRNSGAFCKNISFSRGEKVCNYKSVKNDKLSPRTINARHKALKAVFSRLSANAGLISTPFDFPTLDNNSAHREAFTDAELRLIGENMSMPYSRPIFTIGLCTGLTLGDLCLLRWSEIATIEGKDWITNKVRLKTNVPLEIPILPPLKAFLEEQRPRTGGGEYVCPELAEMYQQNPFGVVYRVREFLERIGIQTAEKVSGRSRAVSTKAAHAMRHSFAYLAGVYNIPQPIVQGVLGHMSPQMTALYQRHAQREQKEKFFRQMPNVLGVATASPAPMIGNAPAPERERLHRLADTLDLETVKKILAEVEK